MDVSEGLAGSPTLIGWRNASTPSKLSECTCDEDSSSEESELSSDENTKTTLSNGYLGSCNDEERSEMRYVV